MTATVLHSWNTSRHQDNGYAYVHPQQYLTIWLALTDATVDNGCPWVAPASVTIGVEE